jgi:4-amino-4-deoxy-L-arabinose transferase-like glycosyltransferase
MFAIRQDEILMPQDETRAIRIGLTAVLLLAAALRAFGIYSGLPFLYDPDEAVFVGRAGSILANRDLNPHFFGHPGSTSIYLLSVLYALIFWLGSLFGAYDGTAAFKNAYFQDPTLFYLSGRILFALFGIASVFLLFRTVRRAFGPAVGLMSALILALSPVHVEFSRLIRTDILMTFLVLVVLRYSQEILEKHDGRSHFLAGFFLGLAIVTKYPAAVGASLIIAASLLRNPNRFSAVRLLLISGAACILGMFIGSPFLFIDYRQVLSDFRAENLNSTLGGTGDGFFANLLWYARAPILHNLSAPGMVFAAVGVIALILKGGKNGILFLVFPLLFWCFIAFLRIRWPRWIIPLVPFVAVFAAVGCVRASSWVRSKISTRWKAIPLPMFFLLLAIPMARLDVLVGLMAHRKDTRTLARDWVVKHVPRGSRLLVEENTCHLPKNDYAFFIVDKNGECNPVDLAAIPEAVFDPPPALAGNLSDPGKIAGMKIDYLILGNWYDRLKYESRRFPGRRSELRNYEKIMNLCTQIYEVNRITHYNQGPTVRVYRVRSASSAAPGSG